jgi:heat-inducible transcriptional repressor
MSDALTHRARKILAAVVHEYLNTGEAVGSRTVTRRHGIDLSPATVRNVMSDLEDAGLLKQPHTSAGRVPTDLGLRFFVDSLLKVRSPSAKEREELLERYAIPTDDLDAALRDAGRVLAELSAHTVVVVTPRPALDLVEHLEFVRLRDLQLLAVLVTKSGQVQNKIVHVAEPIASEELERMNNYLNHMLGGLTLEGMVAKVREELRSERVQYQVLEKRALELSAEALKEGGAGAQVIIEGQSRLIDAVAGALPGPTDPAQLQKMRALFRALEEKTHLAELLDETVRAPGIRVFIGAETHIEELSDFTVVASSYGSSGEDARALGTLGVIGPTRMNYQRVISLVDFTAQLLSDVIAKR